jgi:threonine synthase
VIGYRSTGPQEARVASFKEALFLGQAPDGGLFVPDRVPPLECAALRHADFAARARACMLGWLEDELPPEMIERLCDGAFDFPVPLLPLDERTVLVELFHGPTAAFKDFGARFMAQCMALLREAGRRLTILVATSGDTGAAVAHAFSGMQSVRVVLLYPAGRVSDLQELQLTAVPENAFSLRVDGSFDDCQAMVRTAFGDRELVERLGLASANSINIGRLLPQTVYFLHASLEMDAGRLPPGPGLPRRRAASDRRAGPPLVVVPSGNLGNLTAGLLARMQGAPIARFLAATNRNDAFPRFLAGGVLRGQPTVATPSNAMDVGDPSNAARIAALYPRDLKGLRRDIAGISIGDEETLETMRRTYEESGTSVCPHTAVGLAALRRHRERHEDGSPAVVLATAHPGKFPDAVRAALGHTPAPPPALAGLHSARRAPRDMRPDSGALRAFLQRLV